MGGLGSGRPSGSGRGTVEARRSLDVNRLHREGCLHAGWVGSWQWTSDGEQVASISLRAEADQLHLAYRVRISGCGWERSEPPKGPALVAHPKPPATSRGGGQISGADGVPTGSGLRSQWQVKKEGGFRPPR